VKVLRNGRYLGNWGKSAVVPGHSCEQWWAWTLGCAIM